MKLFIFLSVKKLTEHYHSNGGLVVIAESEETARALAISRGVKELDITEKPTVIRECDGPAGCWIFPNAGCLLREPQ
jgi:hypothetical protein